MNVIANHKLDELAAQLADNIAKDWADPFQSPIVIFADSRLEQWFRFFWLQKKGSALMNLDMLRLEPFLAECVGMGDDQRFLRADWLRDYLVVKLVEKQPNGECYFKSLRCPEIDNYLLDNDKINEVNLFDFAQQMASLLLDYEVTRGERSINTVQRAGLKFYNDLPNDTWQKKLYVDLVRDISIGSGDSLERYTTVFQSWLRGKRVSLPTKYQGRSVHLFGFSGFGQFYRKLIVDLAGSADINIYLQSAHISNKPFDSWVEAGLANLRSLGGEAESQSITRDCLPKNLSFSSCPSKLREVEVLHSQIVDLIASGADLQDIMVLAPSIQEYRTAISQIFDMAKITKKERSTLKDNPSVSIPYVLTDGSSALSYVAEAVGVLVKILEEKSLTRAHFASLVRNPMVQAARGFDDEAAMHWLDWLVEMKAYRTRPSSNDWHMAKRRVLVSRLSNDVVRVDSEQLLPFANIDTQHDGEVCGFVSLVDDLLEWCALSNKDTLDADGLQSVSDIVSRLLFLHGDTPPDLLGEDLVYAQVKILLSRMVKFVRLGVCSTLALRCVMLALNSVAGDIALCSGRLFVDGVTFSSLKPNRILSAKHLFLLGMDSKSFPAVQTPNVLDLRSLCPENGDYDISKRCLDAFFCALFAASDSISISYVSRDLQKDEDFFPAACVEDLLDFVGGSIEHVGIDERRPLPQIYTTRAVRNLKVLHGLEVCPVNSGEQNGNIPCPHSASLSNLSKFISEPFMFYAKRIFGDDDNSEDPANQDIESVDLSPIDKAILKKEWVRRIAAGESESDVRKAFGDRLRLENTVPNSAHLNDILDTVASEGEDMFSWFLSKEDLKALDGFVAAAADAVCGNPFNMSVLAPLGAEQDDVALKNDLASISQTYAQNVRSLVSDKQLSDLCDLLWKKNEPTATVKKKFVLDDEQVGKIYGYRNAYVSDICKRLGKCLSRKVVFDRPINIVVEEDESQNIPSFALTGTLAWHILTGHDLTVFETSKTATKNQNAYVSALAIVAKQSDGDTPYKVKFGNTKSNFSISPEDARGVLRQMFKLAYVDCFHCCMPIDCAVSAEALQSIDELKNKLEGNHGHWQFFDLKDMFDSLKDVGYNAQNFPQEFPKARDIMRSLLKFL